MKSIDVAILGGGPAGLAAALMLSRARRSLQLFDTTPARNARATNVNGFLTRDGIAPAELRRIGREQLAPYGKATVVEEPVVSIERVAEGGGHRFHVATANDVVSARRVLLAVGMVDVVPALPGFADLWGTSIFQCPYCHGWEARDQRFGFFAPSPEMVEFALFLKAWSGDVIVFSERPLDLPEALVGRLAAADIRVEPTPLAGVRGVDGHLAAVVLADGSEVERDVLFARPLQRQVPLVTSLGIALDDNGFIVLDDRRQTSVPGIYAAGDATTQMQGALFAAASGAQTAAMLNHGLVFELVAEGAI